MSKVKIVAEIGCNHNGNIQLAKDLIKEAAKAGADAVKFQTFIAEELVSLNAPKAEYQKVDNADETQLEMIRKLELTQEEYREIKSYSENIGIECFSTGFDMLSVDFLISLGQNVWKIPSGEITNLPYLEKIRDVECINKEIILSTGMSTLDEIRFAVNVLQESKDTKFTILHCNTDYPTKDTDMNLRAIEVLRDNFPGWSVGLSDHSEGVIASLIAVGMGASFIEKHFTIDKSLPGPDHRASIIPKELKELCNGIRRAEVMLGARDKFVTDTERGNKLIARKSIVAKRNILAGEELSIDNITCKRPGNGISPVYWHEVIGHKAEKSFCKDELISVKGIKWQGKC
jgi:N-acetylneuraminate synthase